MAAMLEVAVWHYKTDATYAEISKESIKHLKLLMLSLLRRQNLVEKGVKGK